MRKSSKLIILKDNKVLIRKFNNGSKYIFDLPGGKVEEGETLVKAAVREGIEELGIKVLEPRLIYTEYVEEIDTEGNFFFVTKYENGYEKKPEKDVTIGENIWMSTKEAEEKLSFDICVKALRRALNNE